MVKRYLCIIISIFIAIYASGQIINTESSRIRTDTTGWFGTVSAASSYLLNDNTLFSFDANIHVEHKGKKQLWLFLSNYHFARGTGVNFADEGYLHLRNNIAVTKMLKWEGFVQIQKNSIQNIGDRLLVGTGPRFKLSDHKYFRMYVGTSVMWESETERTDRTIQTNLLRSSNYVSFTVVLGNKGTLENTTYFQPSFGSFGDRRLLTDWRLRIKLFKKFSFTALLTYLYDSQPATGANRNILRQVNGVSYTF
ncbi:MAG: DUF481 domain-containing protein [Saprospiraceae bacterium]|nr:DUF481 domain-containing protein [Saprospiraceae bacterium]